MLAQAFNPSMDLCKFLSNLVYIHSKFQDSQGSREPVSKNKQTRKQKEAVVCQTEVNSGTWELDVQSEFQPSQGDTETKVSWEGSSAWVQSPAPQEKKEVREAEGSKARKEKGTRVQARNPGKGRTARCGAQAWRWGPQITSGNKALQGWKGVSASSAVFKLGTDQ